MKILIDILFLKNISIFIIGIAIQKIMADAYQSKKETNAKIRYLQLPDVEKLFQNKKGAD